MASSFPAAQGAATVLNALHSLGDKPVDGCRPSASNTVQISVVPFQILSQQIRERWTQAAEEVSCCVYARARLQISERNGRGDCWGEGKDVTLRSRPPLQPLVRRRQSGQGHPSQDSAL
jgi:hypothetical protein